MAEIGWLLLVMFDRANDGSRRYRTWAEGRANERDWPDGQPRYGLGAHGLPLNDDRSSEAGFKMGNLRGHGEAGASSSASLLMLSVSTRLRHAGHVLLKLVRRTTNYAVKSNQHLVIR